LFTLQGTTIIKHYPTILKVKRATHKPCIAFHKYDGSNLKFTWQVGRGWCRSRVGALLFDSNDAIFGKAIEVFHDTLSSGIDKVIHQYFPHIREVSVFTEFFGDQSFAGVHVPGDDFRLVLIDVEIPQQGIMDPVTFIKLFKHLPSAGVVYKGNLSSSFIEDVRNNQLSTPLNEGVVCKGGKGHLLWMRKIKTYDYRERLKEKFGDDWIRYWE